MWTACYIHLHFVRQEVGWFRLIEIASRNSDYDNEWVGLIVNTSNGADIRLSVIPDLAYRIMRFLKVTCGPFLLREELG
jgi:hypothetical protein